MGTISDKLQKTLDSKLAIKQAIENKGVSDVGDILADYPAKIAEITTGKTEAELSETITSNGESVFTPSEGSVYNKVTITTNVQPSLQEKTVTPTVDTQEIIPDLDKEGLSKVTVEGVTSSIDSNITPENIKSGVEILSVTGTLEGAKEEQSKSITITQNGTQTITPDEGKVLSEVGITVNVAGEEEEFVQYKDINFFSPFGVLIESWTFEECQTKTSLPNLPWPYYAKLPEDRVVGELYNHYGEYIFNAHWYIVGDTDEERLAYLKTLNSPTVVGVYATKNPSIPELRIAYGTVYTNTDSTTEPRVSADNFSNIFSPGFLSPEVGWLTYDYGYRIQSPVLFVFSGTNSSGEVLIDATINTAYSNEPVVIVGGDYQYFADNFEDSYPDRAYYLLEHATFTTGFNFPIWLYKVGDTATAPSYNTELGKYPIFYLATGTPVTGDTTDTGYVNYSENLLPNTEGKLATVRKRIPKIYTPPKGVTQIDVLNPLFPSYLYNALPESGPVSLTNIISSWSSCNAYGILYFNRYLLSKEVSVDGSWSSNWTPFVIVSTSYSDTYPLYSKVSGVFISPSTWSEYYCKPSSND